MQYKAVLSEHQTPDDCFSSTWLPMPSELTIVQFAMSDSSKNDIRACITGVAHTHLQVEPMKFATPFAPATQAPHVTPTGSYLYNLTNNWAGCSLEFTTLDEGAPIIFQVYGSGRPLILRERGCITLNV